MSIFASDTTVTIDIPFDPPHTVTLRKLSGRQLVKAQQAFFAGLISDIQERGGPKVQKEIQELFAQNAADQQAAVAELKASPLNGLDKYAIAYDGIKAWSYPKSLERVVCYERGQDGRDVALVRIPAIDDLDDVALEFFATEIMRLTKPSLFQNEAEKKAEQKNG